MNITKFTTFITIDSTLMLSFEFKVYDPKVEMLFRRYREVYGEEESEGEMNGVT